MAKLYIRIYDNRDPQVDTPSFIAFSTTLVFMISDRGMSVGTPKYSATARLNADEPLYRNIV